LPSQEDDSQEDNYLSEEEFSAPNPSENPAQSGCAVVQPMHLGFHRIHEHIIPYSRAYLLPLFLRRACENANPWQVRRIVIGCVLATDMAGHFEHLSALEASLARGHSAILPPALLFVFCHSPSHILVRMENP
jgi:hypothetical protein